MVYNYFLLQLSFFLRIINLIHALYLPLLIYTLLNIHIHTENLYVLSYYNTKGMIVCTLFKIPYNFEIQFYKN